MTLAAIGLGSNLGDRERNLRLALQCIGSEMAIVAVSKLYETAPMYVEDQPSFLNGAAMLETDLGPLPLLNFLKAIEKQTGRTDSKRNGPREIDLDLLTYGTATYVFRLGVKELLTLPHPRIPERRFVLQPLNDIDSELMLPGLGKVHSLLHSTEVQAQSVLETTNALLSVHSG
jgi:2-amino-4-hydroxy-6-hydroxymethyldihydropteridine diphosphokinase